MKKIRQPEGPPAPADITITPAELQKIKDFAVREVVVRRKPTNISAQDFKYMVFLMGLQYYLGTRKVKAPYQVQWQEDGEQESK